MTEQKYKEVLDAEAWIYICRIVDHIPADFAVAAHPDDASLITGLGAARAFRALLALQDALQIYFSDLVFAAVRASCARPIAARRASDAVLPDEQEWAQMYDVPWLAPGAPSEIDD